jgi:hypothetical protein
VFPPRRITEVAAELEARTGTPLSDHPEQGLLEIDRRRQREMALLRADRVLLAGKRRSSARFFADMCAYLTHLARFPCDTPNARDA